MVKLDATAKEVRYGTWEIGGPRHYYRERLILKNLQKFIPNGRVLDVGCGTGSLLTKLTVGGYKVYGIDMSEECLEITSKRLKRFSSNNHGEVKKGNASQIDYPTDFFDAVIAAEVMEHLEEDYLAVKEFHRVLRPGGISLITVPANPGLWDIWDEKAGHKRRYRREDFLKLYNG